MTAEFGSIVCDVCTAKETEREKKSGWEQIALHFSLNTNMKI